MMKRERADQWAEFVGEVAQRLAKGEQAYKDRTFTLTPAQIMREMEEELFDVAAYAFIGWVRVRELRAQLQAESETYSWSEVREALKKQPSEQFTIAIACNGEYTSEFSHKPCNQPRMDGSVLCEHHWNKAQKPRRNDT